MPDQPNTRRHVVHLKPLWRFGWAGWLIALGTIPLLLLAFSDYNPIYEMQSAVVDRWGPQAMYGFTVYLVVYPWRVSTGIIPGPCVLLWLMLALGVYPRRVPLLWCCYFTALCLGAPMLSGNCVIRDWLGFRSMVDSIGLNRWTAYEAFQLMLLEGRLWMCTRSRRVIAVFTGAILVFRVPWEVFGGNTLIDAHWLWPWSVLAWHLACAAALFEWALHQRRLAKQWWVCRVCLYDLRGCPTTICPECGTTRDPDSP